MSTLEPNRELEEERDFLLRSLRDLEAERAAGDIDDLDYQTLRDGYTVRAAATLRALDPTEAVEEPEALVEEAPVDLSAEPDPLADADPLAGADLAVGTDVVVGTDVAVGTGTNSRRGARSVSADGIKKWMRPRRRRLLMVAVVVIVLAGIGFAVVAGSSHREAGEEITGQGVGAGQETKLLQAAQTAEDKGDATTELKDVQSILQSDPTQPQALTMEGWLFAQTGQKNLLPRAIGLLTLAEQVDPSYAEPHVYRAIAFLSEGDNRDAIPELKWYLAHKPDPTLVGKVRTSLRKAEAAVASAPTKTGSAAAKPAPSPTKQAG